MSYYLKSGDTVTIKSDNSLIIDKKLEPLNYIVQVDSNGNFFLRIVDDFTMPEKLYGKTEKHCQRILNTYKERSGNLGVMLVGNKGSGKSLLSKLISRKCKEIGMPTIIINQPYHGDTFNKFIQDIDVNTVIIFDEFEKVYEKTDQEKILTLFDGMFESKKLFVITSNSSYMIDDNMFNRPGRIYYQIEYSGLSEEFITEFCQANLNDKTQINSIIKISNLFTDFNFDMLKSMIEEMNRYQESAEEAVELLNIKPNCNNRINERRYYIEEFEENGVSILDKLNCTVYYMNPFIESVVTSTEAVEYTMNPSDITKMNLLSGNVEYKGENLYMRLKADLTESFNFRGAF